MIVENTIYRKPCVVLIGFENDYPLFGRVEDIFVVNCKILFHVTILKTEYFCNHLQAFIIAYTSNTDVLLCTQLYSYIPMHIHRIPLDENMLNVIVCKYHLCDTT